MEPSGLRLDTFTSSAMELAKGILSRLGLTTGAPLLPFVPKPVKLTLILLLVLNAPSFPLVWHLRVLLFPYRSFLLVRLQGKRKWLDDWSKRNDDKGRIARIKTVSKRRAWLDDCDFNGHLSNSCYAKSADPARIEFCGQALNPLFHAGAHCALGGSYYTFIKEIPVGSEFYVITEFIIYPKKGSSKTKNTKDTKDKGRTNGANVANGANGVNGANIPANYSSVAVAVEQAKASLAAALPSPPPPLGMTLSADPSPSVSGTTTPATSDHGNSNGTRTGATTPGTDLLEPLDSLDSLEAAKTVAGVLLQGREGDCATGERATNVLLL
ncbi:hypothetical protein EHS25_009719 [Saitozyma podzolica]|uniref:Thioesterase domain-containing protein n=1 Tax=Saitozyma podzolica TaxID=1890683 RepID=A0A427YK21_9TREE|nr:hypothetical protein EHS25_009719 [Saitozyma podzolica]